MTGTLDGMEDQDLAELAVRVEAARLANEWSKERVAREAGVSAITYKRVEDGLRVQDAKLAAILNALGLSNTSIDISRVSVSADEHDGLATIKARKPANMTDEDFKRLLAEYEEELQWKLDRAARER